jgi:hypothetical protein
MLAAAASTSHTVFRSQYIQRLEVLVRSDERLRNWEFYMGLVRRYLWWGYLLDPLAREAFTAVSWQDIDGTGCGVAPARELGPGNQEASPELFSWRSTSNIEHSLRAIP